MLLTGRIDNTNIVCDTQDEYDEVWCIVRNLKCSLPASDKPVYHVPQLSPSERLYSATIKRKKSGSLSPDEFSGWFTPAFHKEMQEDTAVKYLKLLRRRSEFKNVLIVCFCQNKELCHRSLVEGIITQMQNQPQQTEPFYCLVAGSRTFDNFAYLKHKLDSVLFFQDKVEIVSGGAKGADALAEQYAAYRGCSLKVFPADWDTYGKSAGFKRNRQMHEYIAEKSHRGVVCFWDGQSKGTADNFTLAKEFNNPLKVYQYNQTPAPETVKEASVNLDMIPCLWDDYPCSIKIDGITYSNAEAAIQGQKCTSETQKMGLSLLSAKEAKKIGDSIQREDWEILRILARELVLEEMLHQNEESLKALMSTGTETLTSDKDPELAELYTRIRKGLRKKG